MGVTSQRELFFMRSMIEGNLIHTVVFLAKGDMAFRGLITLISEYLGYEIAVEEFN